MSWTSWKINLDAECNAAGVSLRYHFPLPFIIVEFTAVVVCCSLQPFLFTGLLQKSVIMMPGMVIKARSDCACGLKLPLACQKARG